MADRYRTKDGWSVEAVRLTCTPDHHDGEWLRIRYRGYFVHDAKSVSDLERYFLLSELDAEALAGAVWMEGHILSASTQPSLATIVSRPGRPLSHAAKSAMRNGRNQRDSSAEPPVACAPAPSMGRLKV